jgi:hypothetical protein
MKFFSIVFLFALVGCGEPLTREDLLPDASGAHGEIILLMEDNVWEGAIGQTVFAWLDQDTKGPALRPEPMFTVIRKRPDQLNHLSQLNRLLLKIMIDHDSTYAETAVIEKKDYYAKGQLFIIIKDSDANRMLDFVRNDFGPVVERFNEFETSMLIAEYKNRYNKNVMEKAKTKFGIAISLPKESETKVDSADFLWVKRERSKHLLANEKGGQNETYWIQQGILFWSEPYRDTTQLTIAGVLQKRDSVLKYHVPGKIEGSYMATEYDPYYKPQGRVFTYKDAYAIECRGLWVHRGHPAAFGGGPFVQYTLHHKGRGEVITVCGYVYAPRFEKREYIREIDAMLNTIEFVE